MQICGEIFKVQLGLSKEFLLHLNAASPHSRLHTHTQTEQSLPVSLVNTDNIKKKNLFKT